MEGNEARIRPTHIGQVALGVQDVERATAFYRDVLGLQHLFSAPPGLSFFQCGEVRIMLSESEGGAEPRGSILYYAIEDVEAAHQWLVEGGAEEVAGPHSVHRTDRTDLWMGFYRDTEGNLFASMNERPREEEG
jgi:methylmalonyl-CoA/ethylmalonyl-CoA epimerase